MMPRIAQSASDPALWPLDPQITFLNHGSFGSCPHAVLEFQRQMRDRLERQPVQFLVRDLEPLLDRARASLARFLKADADNLVFVPNATAGLNTVLRSLCFKRGDELLVTDHEYNASRNVLNFVAEQSGARVIVAKVPFPLKSTEEITDAILGRVTSRTRLALLDHVTSQTGLIFPIEELVRKLSARGIETLVDGAHALGMVPLNLKNLAPPITPATAINGSALPKPRLSCTSSPTGSPSSAHSLSVTAPTPAAPTVPSFNSSSAGPAPVIRLPLSLFLRR